MKINKRIFLAIFGATFFLNPVFGMEEDKFGHDSEYGYYSDSEIPKRYNEDPTDFEEEQSAFEREYSSPQNPTSKNHKPKLVKPVLLSDSQNSKFSPHTIKEEPEQKNTDSEFKECECCHKSFKIYPLYDNKIPNFCVACFMRIAEAQNNYAVKERCKVCDFFYSENSIYSICSDCIEQMKSYVLEEMQKELKEKIAADDKKD